MGEDSVQVLKRLLPALCRETYTRIRYSTPVPMLGFAWFGFVRLFLTGWKTGQAVEKSTKTDLRNIDASCSERLSKRNIILEEFGLWLDYTACKSCQRKDVLSAQELLHHLVDKGGNEKLHRKNKWSERKASKIQTNHHLLMGRSTDG